MVQLGVAGAQVLPQLGLLAQGGGRAVDDEEDGGDGHHHGQVAGHIPGQLALGLVELLEVVAVDHQLGDPHLLVYPGDHHLFVHALVGPADEVAVEIHIHVVDALYRRQGLVDKDVVHIEGVLGQLQPAGAQHLGAVDDRVHQQVLGGPEAADLVPGEHAALGEHVGILHHLLRVVLHVLIDVVGDKEVQRLLRPGERPQLVQNGLQGRLVQPVVGVHHLIVHPLGVAIKIS